ncbi:MAG: nickel-dependent lactate racemase [Synergistaceae bacterium]|jgi:nickel-dependent lactate racemase|nr:nickel-dependent lactate racemase [Synergistaceae bacterium]
MDITLKYGRKEVRLSLPDRNVLGVLEPSASLPPIKDLGAAVRAVLATPTAGPSLSALMEEKKPRGIAIIVNDMTRSTPTYDVLPPLLEELTRLGATRESITIVVATGTHRAMTPEEIEKAVGGGVVSAGWKIVNHDCDAPDLVDMGTLPTGNKMKVNKIVAESDLRIAIGEVLLHYYAGFAGGRKSILPGVAGRETVMRNHAMMTAPGVGIGLLEGNRVYEETDVAVEKFCPLHFIVNLVSDSHKNVVRVVGGHFRDAWMEGVKTFRAMNFVSIPKRADAVIVSAGGYPKDINMYQAHKGIYMASRAVRNGGAMVFFAELEEGYGHKVFAEWAERGWTKEQVMREFEAEFRFGAHKLYYMATHARDFDMYLYSKMNERESRLMFCEKIDKTDDVLPMLQKRFGEDFTAWVIPQGGIVLPNPAD